MKSILVIGAGRFGRHLCQKFMHLGNEVLVVDCDENAIGDLANEVTSARIADCTDEHVLQTLGVRNFDLCFVCMGEHFENGLLITALLRDIGARRVIAKANCELHARLLLRNGADEVVYPEKDSAERMAVRQLDMRNRYQINILAVKLDGVLRPMPGADYQFTGEEHVLALASADNARKLLKKI